MVFVFSFIQIALGHTVAYSTLHSVSQDWSFQLSLATLYDTKITRHCPHIPLPLDFSNCFFIYKKLCYLACAHYNFPTFLGIWNLKVWFFFAFLLCSSIYRNRGKNHFQKNSDQKFASFYKTRKEPALKIDILSNILRLWIIHFHFCNSQFDWTRTIFRRQIFYHVHHTRLAMRKDFISFLTETPFIPFSILTCLWHESLPAPRLKKKE